MLWPVLIAFVALVTLWLMWMWAREARREGTRLSPALLASGLLVPILAVGLYGVRGFHPDTAEWVDDVRMLEPMARQLAAGETPDSVAEGVTAPRLARVLQRELARSPSADGWYALGVLYGELEVPQLAVESARKALRLDPDSLSNQLLLAQGLMGEAGGRLTDEAGDLLDGILARYPQHDSAWLMVGLGAMQSGDFKRAEQAWEALLERHGDSQIATMLNQNLEQARSQGAAQKHFAELSVDVTSATPVADGGTLFVFLQRAGESGQPLAARRLLVQHLPQQVSLRAEDWLQAYPAPGTELVVGARYAPSAAAGVGEAQYQAAPQPWRPGASVTLELLPPQS